MSRSQGRRWRHGRFVALGVGLALALVAAGSAAQPAPPASAAAVGQASQRPGGVPYTVTATPITDVIDGQSVKVNVTSTPAYPVYGIQIQLCRFGPVYQGNGYQALHPDFRTGGPNCPAQQISSNADSLVIDPPQAIGNAVAPGGETLTYHVGQGTANWANNDEGGKPETLTCDVADPCGLVVEVLAGVDPGIRWEPWVFRTTYRNNDPLSSCGGPADGILRTAGGDRIQDAYIDWTVDLCKRPGQAGALTSTSFSGEVDALDAFTKGSVDVAYTALGYSDAAHLIPADLSQPNGGHRNSIAIPLALNATVMAAGNGEVAQGKKVPYPELKLTTPEAATMIAQGSFGINPYVNDILARNPGMTGVFSTAFGGLPAVNAKSDATSWLASRYFQKLAPAQWVVGGLGDLKPLWGLSRSVDASFALADPTFVGVLRTMTDIRGGVRKGLIGQTLDDTGGAWVLTDLATARSLDLTVAQITNAGGGFVTPTPASMEAAVAAMTPDASGILIPDPTMSTPAGTSADAAGAPYPLTFVEYALVPAEPLIAADCTTRTASQAHLTQWLEYLTGDGQKNLPAGMEPLPESLLTEARGKIAQVGAAPSTRNCPPPETPPTTTDPNAATDPVSGTFDDASGDSSSFGDSSYSSDLSGSGSGSGSSGYGSSGVGGSGSGAAGNGPAAAGGGASTLAGATPAASVLPGFGGNRAASVFLALLTFLLIMGLVSGAVVISSGRLPTRKGSSSGPGGSA